MTDEWGPWIAHDLPIVGDYIQLEGWSVVIGKYRHEGFVTAVDNGLWRMSPELCGRTHVYRWRRRRLPENPMVVKRKKELEVT